MKERTGIITMKGGPLTLLGDEIRIGDRAPDFEVTGTDLSPVKLSNYKGKTLIISAVPSLDTPVCDTETRRFNKEASNLGNNTKILTISMDLPFAQARWCGATGIDRVTTLSDYKNNSFGKSYGILIKELRLLARAIFIIDKEGIVKYVQLVKEVTEEPNYEEVLKAAKELST